MALLKTIEATNGIVLNYHRIVSIGKITNKTSIIEVASYIDESKRQQEILYEESTDPNKRLNVYIQTTYINKEYNEAENIQDIYAYLKTLDMFKEAEDI